MAPKSCYLIYLGIIFGISYCATSEATNKENQIGLRIVEESGLFDDNEDDYEYSDEQPDAGAPIEGDWALKYGNSFTDLLSVKNTGGEEGATSSPCGVNVQDMNWHPLYRKSSACIVKILSNSQSAPETCGHKDEVRSCFTDLIEATGCFSVWSTYKDYLFNPEEIFENGWKALCTGESSPRITRGLESFVSGNEVLKECWELQWDQVKEQVDLCIESLGVKLDFEDICGFVDILEKVIMCSFKVCKWSEAATKTAESYWDVIMGLSVKCPHHPRI